MYVMVIILRLKELTFNFIRNLKLSIFDGIFEFEWYCIA